MRNDNFFGRQSYISLLEKRIYGLKDGYRQNIAIIGDELVGKTSIMRKLIERIADNNFVMFYIEARPESFDSFCRRFIGILLYSFLLNSGMELKEDLDFLIGKSQRHIPNTVAKIRSILVHLQKGKKNDLFSDLLSITESLHQETSKRCVVFIDEFHNLENISLRYLYRDWSKLLISQKNTMYIIASSARHKARNILSSNLSLLFGNFEIINVEPFDIKTAEDYLCFRFSGAKVDKGLIDFIIHFTGGYPFYLDIISDALVNTLSKDLTDILEEMLFEPSGILNQRFSNYLKRFQDKPKWQEYLSILYLIASGNNKINDIAHLLHKQKKEVLNRVDHLIETDTVSRSADFLIINDRVFGFWLKFVYQGKSSSLTFDDRNQKNIFRDKIDTMIRDFLAASGRNVLDRLMELLHLFGDDTISIEKRKIRLDHLREVKPLEFKGRSLREGIIGRSSDALWIMGLKNDFLTEEDVSGFVKECKKYRHKAQKKVIIALHQIDPNARLRAIEEKVFTWDINNLNQILDVFSRPRVIT